MGQARRIADSSSSSLGTRAMVGPDAHARSSVFPANTGVERASAGAHHSIAEAARADAEAHRLPSPGGSLNAPGMRSGVGEEAAQLHVQPATL